MSHTCKQLSRFPTANLADNGSLSQVLYEIGKLYHKAGGPRQVVGCQWKKHTDLFFALPARQPIMYFALRIFNFYGERAEQDDLGSSWSYWVIWCCISRWSYCHCVLFFLLAIHTTHLFSIMITLVVYSKEVLWVRCPFNALISILGSERKNELKDTKSGSGWEDWKMWALDESRPEI